MTSFFSRKSRMERMLKKQSKLSQKARESEQEGSLRESISRQKARISKARGPSKLSSVGGFAVRGAKGMIEGLGALGDFMGSQTQSSSSRRSRSRKSQTGRYHIVGGVAYPIAGSNKRKKGKRRSTRSGSDDFDFLGDFKF